MPLAPSGLRGDGVCVRSVSKRRQVARARDRVGRERAGDVVAVLVEGDLLEQRLRDALGDAAVDLALEQLLVVDAARVVDGDVPDELRQAGLGVDLDDGEVGAERVRGVRRLEVVLAPPGRPRSPRARETGPWPRRRAAPTGSREAGEPATPSPWPGTTSMSPASASSRCAASRRAFSSTSSVACWTAVPPTCSEREPIVPMPRLTSLVSDWMTLTSGERDAERAGDELRVGGLVALAVRGRAGGDDRPCRPRAPRRCRALSRTRSTRRRSRARGRAGRRRRGRGAPSARRAAAS